MRLPSWFFCIHRSQLKLRVFSIKFYTFLLFLNPETSNVHDNKHQRDVFVPPDIKHIAGINKLFITASSTKTIPLDIL